MWLVQQDYQLAPTSVQCKVRAEVPWERVLKRGKAGQVDILGSQVCAGQRAWLQPRGCTLMGCRCPISGGQGWAKAQPGRARTGTKRGQEQTEILEVT